jgi:alpha-D-xyloside xylohydrolase
MKKIARHLLIFGVSISFIFIAIACNKYRNVEVEFTEKNYFPVVKIADPGNGNIVISPVSLTEGSIGVKLNDSVYWVQGIPQKRHHNSYIWKIDRNISVIMNINNTKDESHISLIPGNSNMKPSEWFVNIESQKKEFYTGIFERVVDGAQSESWKKGISTALNLRGEKVEMKIKPTVSAYSPFYISSSGYGFACEGTWPGTFDFCKSNKNSVKIAFEGPELHFKFYFGKPLEMVQKHALETGPSIVPPEWAMGPWRWRDDHVNYDVYYDGTIVHAPFNSDLVEDILMMKALDIPLTAYWIDRPWSPGIRGFDDYEFDTLRFPHPEEMIQWLNSRNINPMIWIAPFVMGDMAKYAEEKGYNLVSRSYSNYPQTLIDFTNPEACKWWAENGPGKLARMGFKGFKLDRADGEKLIDSLHLKTFSGITYRQNYNDYPRQYVKAAYDAVKPVQGNDFILFPRAQYVGSSKYGAMWAGDTDGSPEGLRSAIIGMQRCAVMGYPLWGSDIGGYWGDYSDETCMRWLAFGCFSPVMEVGPTNNRGFWNVPDTPHYNTELLATWRFYSQLRMVIKDYLYQLAEEASEKGTPVIRPLFLMYPEQEESWKDWQTYMVGNDILVSAIWEKDVQSHSLYLPAGEKWIDAWNPSKTYEGGQYVKVKAPLNVIPIFLRKGSSLQLGDLNSKYKKSLEIVSQIPDLQEMEIKEGWRE